jgi:hypothetical protein
MGTYYPAIHVSLTGEILDVADTDILIPRGNLPKYIGKFKGTEYLAYYAYRESNNTTPAGRAEVYAYPEGDLSGVGHAIFAKTNSLGGFVGAPANVQADGGIAFNLTEDKPILYVLSTNHGIGAYKLDIDRAAVLSVSVTPKTATVLLGATQQFSAEVSVEGGAAQTVDWDVTGATAAGTTISAGGLLTVAANETATTLEVIASATADATKQDNATVTITASSIKEQVLSPILAYQKGDKVIVSGAEVRSIDLLSVSGQTIKKVNSRSEINVSGLTGVYLLKIQVVSGQTIVAKVIIR